jgi:L-alanine-DL-glutamate epimerase-like enolase superfamily enzyme
MTRRLDVAVERFPIAGRFVISRGARTEAVVVTVRLEEDGAAGWGECVPYARYGETVEGVVAAIEALRPRLEAGLDRSGLQDAMPAGAARNAVDCALWDLEAKRARVPAAVLAGIDRLRPATTAYTISLGSPEEMAEATAKAADRPILKIKLGGPDGDLERIRAVRDAAPDATLIADANEGWAAERLVSHLRACADAGFALVEQPLPAGADDALAEVERPVLVCADESAHDRRNLDRIAALYDAMNIKLDKTGGLTEALATAQAAQERGLAVMVGCMLATSLAMAPAMLLTPRARFVDLDGPLLLARDRDNGLRFEGSLVHPPAPTLWG